MYSEESSYISLLAFISLGVLTVLLLLMCYRVNHLSRPGLCPISLTIRA